MVGVHRLQPCIPALLGDAHLLRLLVVKVIPAFLVIALDRCTGSLVLVAQASLFRTIHLGQIVPLGAVNFRIFCFFRKIIF